jgi:hypothetical protein
MFTFKKSDNLEIIGYSDFVLSGCVDSKNFTSCYIFMLVGELISWKSAKQFITESSTMQVEFVTCYETTDQAVWLKNFVHGLQVIGSVARQLTLLYNIFLIEFK